MAGDEQIRIDITATDDASKVLDKVAESADKLEKADPEVTATADTNAAERGLRDVADQADKLAGQDATITATVTDQASGPLADIFGELDKLKAQAREADDSLDNVGKKAASPGGGPRLAGNAMSDLTGPLGEASSAAGDFGGVFDGLSDVAEKVAGKIGLSEAATAGLTSALGLAGFAVAGAAVVYGLWNQRQKEAAERAKALADGQRKLNDELAKGNTAAAAAQFADLYKDALHDADKFGVSVEEVTKFITGQADTIPSLTKAIADNKQVMEGNTDASDKARVQAFTTDQQLRVLTDTLNGSKTSYDAANGSIKDQDANLKNVTRAMEGAAKQTDTTTSAQRAMKDSVDNTTAAYKRLRDGLDFSDAFASYEAAFWAAADTTGQTVAESESDVRELKRTILDLAESVHANPVQVETTLKAVDAGDYAAVARQVAAMSALNPVKLSAILVDPATGRPRQGSAAGGGPVIQSVPGGGGGGAPVVNVTQYIPRGWRGDALGAARAAAKRSGGLYMRAAR